MYAITRRLDVLAPVLIDCDYSSASTAASERKEHNMETTPAIENAVAWFGAHTVTHHLDVVDRVAVSIVNTLTADGSTVRFYNANGYEFMTLKSDDVSKRFESLLDERLVGTRHAEDGRLYAILKDGDRTREEPVDLFPFADVQVAVEYGPATVTVSLIAPFAELVTATRPYSESEADWLL
jgi:hypothetical protein